MSDLLRSRAFARIVDLVSEGEIVGLVNGAKSIYFNGTPLENADNSRNFENVTYDARVGTQAQDYIPDAAAIESSVNVATEVKNTASVTRTISNSDVNAVRVIVSVQALFRTKDNGNQVGTDVQLAIDVQTNGGGYVEKLRDTISGKATSKYQRAYRIALTGTGPWDIRVRRLTDDSTDIKLQNKTFWDSYSEIIDTKLRYPNSALVAVKLDAASFQGIPSRAYDLKLLKVKVPTNYDPIARTYTGAWDGTFKTEWTDNPAWCFYDLVTNTRYGLGNYIPAAQVDKWGLYTISQYCDQLVDDGFGGQEPRFTCNLYLQSRAEAYKVINDLASCFRAMVYWASGSLTVSQDAPSDPVALFTQANVIDGRFTYSGASAKARHTVALVSWNDPADFYKQKIEYVEDAEGIARFGVVPTEVSAIGCTSRGQANRVGRWLLYSERYESETVSFQTGIEAAMVRPGNVIKVADSARAGTRLGGRVISATTTEITVDAAPILGGGSWTMYVMLPDGTVESKTVSSAVDAVVTLGSALSAAPQAGAQWIISGSATEAQTFRVVSISEQEGGVLEITALKHRPDKYAAVEEGLVLQPQDITQLDVVPDATNFGQLTEYLYATPTDVRVGITISWAPVNYAAQYLVQYRVDSGNVFEQTVRSNSIEVLNAETGNYAITVYALSAIGKQSLPYTFAAAVLGKTARPADVTGLQIAAQGTSALLQWDLHPDLDVRIGGLIAVRHSELSFGAQWATSIPVAEFPGAARSGSVPLIPGTYLARAIDSTGQQSFNAASVSSATLSVFQYNAVVTADQDPSFSGTKTNMVVVSNKLRLAQSGGAESPTAEVGTYEFASYVDVGAVYTSRVSIKFDAVAYDVANLVDGWPAIDTIGEVDLGALTANFVDIWTDWDAITNFDSESILGDATLTFEFATTDDDPAGSPLWSAWKTFYVGDYTARAFKFRLILDRGSDEYQQVEFAALSAIIDVPDRIESAKNVSVPSGGLAVTFTNQFYDVPAVAVTGANLATGDYVEITGKTSAGFTMQFKNSAGTGVARTADWIAKGFGYKSS